MQKAVTAAMKANKNATEDGGVRWAKKGYQKFDWTKEERDLAYRTAEREIGSDKNYIDKITKYLYASENCINVFAIYGIGDGTEVTILYAAGGKTAQYDSIDISDYMEGKTHGTYKNRAEFNRWSLRIRDSGWEAGNNLSNAENRQAEGYADRLYVRQQERDGRSHYGRSGENQQESFTGEVMFSKKPSTAKDAAYFSIAEKYRDGTATEAETEQLRKMVVEAAKKAMPNTKVVDENGNQRRQTHSVSSECFVAHHRYELDKRSVLNTKRQGGIAALPQSVYSLLSFACRVSRYVVHITARTLLNCTVVHAYTRTFLHIVEIKLFIKVRKSTVLDVKHGTFWWR